MNMRTVPAVSVKNLAVCISKMGAKGWIFHSLLEDTRRKKKDQTEVVDVRFQKPMSLQELKKMCSVGGEGQDD